MSPNIKTDKLWQLHFPISSDDELNDKDFIYDSKILHIEQIHNKEDGISYAVIKFPEPNNEKLFKVKFSKDVKMYCSTSLVLELMYSNKWDISYMMVTFIHYQLFYSFFLFIL